MSLERLNSWLIKSVQQTAADEDGGPRLEKTLGPNGRMEVEQTAITRK